eukprot:1726924-Rhodomonas_salina.1
MGCGMVMGRAVDVDSGVNRSGARRGLVGIKVCVQCTRHARTTAECYGKLLLDRSCMKPKGELISLGWRPGGSVGRREQWRKTRGVDRGEIDGGGADDSCGCGRCAWSQSRRSGPDQKKKENCSEL